MLAQGILTLVCALNLVKDCIGEPTDGVLIFWGDKNFKGEKWDFHRTLDPQFCYNDNVGEPSSITWSNQVTTGKFGDGKAKIAFYTEHDCKGTCRSWFTTTLNFPTNLALDGIDNQIKSFMIWQTSEDADVVVRDAANFVQKRNFM